MTPCGTCTGHSVTPSLLSPSHPTPSPTDLGYLGRCLPGTLHTTNRASWLCVGWVFLGYLLPDTCSVCIQWLSLSTQTLCDPIDPSPPGPSVYGISQTRILEQVAISSSRGIYPPRDLTFISYISCIGRWVLCNCTTWGVHWEVLSKVTGTGGCHLLKVMLSITSFLQASPWSCPPEALRPCGQGLGEALKSTQYLCREKQERH